MRQAAELGLAVALLAVLVIGLPSVLFSPTLEVGGLTAADAEPAREIYSPVNADSGMWPYVSPTTEHRRHSAINVIVLGEPETVLPAMKRVTDREWQEVNQTRTDAEPGTYTLTPDDDDVATGFEWGEAVGSTRYAWIDPGPGEEPAWTTETAQLQAGDYYGHRVHIRMYAPQAEADWVAMQTHSEHFDWFTLKHRVDGVEAAQHRVEADLRSLPQVDAHHDLRRVWLANDGPSDANGWATVVELASLLGLPLVLGAGLRARVGSLGDWPRESWQRFRTTRLRIEDWLSPHNLRFGLTIFGLVLGVRLGGVALERYATVLSMHGIAAILYPFLALGLPLATVYFGRNGHSPATSAGVVAAAFAAAVWIDYRLVEVSAIPIDLVFQRMLLVGTLGLLAAGATRSAQRGTARDSLLVAGAGLWIAGLIATLVGLL